MLKRKAEEIKEISAPIAGSGINTVGIFGNQIMRKAIGIVEEIVGEAGFDFLFPSKEEKAFLRKTDRVFFSFCSTDTKEKIFFF